MAEDATPPAGETFDDDRPVHTRWGEVPPEVQAPLAKFDGEVPPAPAWFDTAVAKEPERTFVKSQGTDIELLTWGEVGKPGLLLVHGNSAHADWWSFIAPLLAEDYRVAAMSLAGMGASGWRDVYSFEGFAEDAEACARAAGLYEGPHKPIYIGHSFGGSQVYYAAVTFPERMHAAILVDVGFGGPPTKEQLAEMMKAQGKNGAPIRAIPTTDRPKRVYPTMAKALERFRLMPPQPVENFYIADFIARRSLKSAPMPDGSGDGWTWRFDPAMWDKLDRTAMNALQKGGPRPANAPPMVHVCGERSIVGSRRPQSPLTDLVTFVIPDSNHHVMIDQPLAFVTAVRGLLAVWPA
jgi:pimeloyl-ACP methyl ester carboxylesterase